MTTDVINTDPKRTDRDRSITFEWLIQTIGPKVDEYAVLTVSHDGQYRRFSASLSQEIVSKRDTGFLSRSFSLYGGKTIAVRPVARFSQKALDAFATEALAALRGMLDDEKVVSLVTPSDRSCGCQDTHHEPGCEVYAAQARARTRR